MIRQAGCVPLGSRQHCPLERHVPDQEDGDGDGVPDRDDDDGEPDQDEDDESSSMMISVSFRIDHENNDKYVRDDETCPVPHGTSLAHIYLGLRRPPEGGTS